MISRFTDAAKEFCEEKTARREIRRVDVTDIAAFNLTLEKWSGTYNDEHKESGVRLKAGETEVYGRGPEFKITVVDRRNGRSTEA